MSQIIAGTYEIEEKIGAGGAGVVYLGKHLRLGKKVVLKADKRKITTKPETLRREVDALKNLSHTYIPQVYDFVVENDTVYTVMDYIEGESFDKPLKRGERFTQPEIIRWTYQLLQALQYLHSQPPYGILHGDIKPANIMLTPQGDIRLIDFNIALALGEEGAVKVGYSQGYASPEHYGLDFSSRTITETSTGNIKLNSSNNTATETMTGDDSETETMNNSDSKTETMVDGGNRVSSGSTSGHGSVMLDARSDIYSLGATLYHIITGRRPAKEIEDIIPISTEEASPAVIEIIEKAMQPNPDLRYQTADEMMEALRNLYENDSRTKHFKRIRTTTSIILIVIFLAGGFTSFTGLKRTEMIKNSYALAEYSQNALQRGDKVKAVNLALEALPESRNIFTPPYTAEAQKALADALGVYDLSDGYKDYGVVSLPKEMTKLAVNENGTYFAAMCAGNLEIIDAQSLESCVSFKTDVSALSDVVFVDNDTVAFAGEGALIAYDIAGGKELWRGKPATGISVSADGSAIAAVYKDESEATIYNSKTGEVLSAVSFGGKHQPVVVNDTFADPEDAVFELNSDGKLLAASFDDGSLMVFDVNVPDNDLEIYDESDYSHFEGGFYSKYFAFSSTKTNESVFAVIDCKEAVQTGGFDSQNAFGVQADESGIYVSTENLAVKIDPETGVQEERAYTDAGIIKEYARGDKHTLVATDENKYYIFDTQAKMISQFESDVSCDFVGLSGDYAVMGSMSSADVRVMKLTDKSESQVFSYSPDYEHDEARLSADKSTVMFFRYDSFRLCNIDGSTICEQKIPDAEQVYDQQYRRNEKGSYLEVIYNDGLRRCYSAVDGSIMSEEQGEAVDSSLYEEFFTDSLKITSPLHGTPTVYDRKSGKKIKELESDAYLTYVTQVGENVITEYIDSDGNRYGLLLNDKCETLAKLPELCDIIDGELLFDYRSGNIRKSRIYSIDELIALGRESGESQS